MTQGPNEQRLRLTRVVADPGAAPCAHVELTFDARRRSRHPVTLSDGTAAGLFLPRGTVLRGGDVLRAEDGRTIEVVAAPESVVTFTASNSTLLARACYHLGNRHVPVQVGDGYARFLRDHVLEDMVRALGVDLAFEVLPFEPEVGAYGAHTHTHSHGDDG